LSQHDVHPPRTQDQEPEQKSDQQFCTEAHEVTL
jgi:hypothetical protein